MDEKIEGGFRAARGILNPDNEPVEPAEKIIRRMRDGASKYSFEVEQAENGMYRATLHNDLIEWGYGDSVWAAIAEYCTHFAPDVE